MNFSGNRALSDKRNLRSGILFLALIPACLLASGAHAQLTYIDQYATGTVEDLNHSDGSQGTRFSALRGVGNSSCLLAPRQSLGVMLNPEGSPVTDGLSLANHFKLRGSARKRRIPFASTGRTRVITFPN